MTEQWEGEFGCCYLQLIINNCCYKWLILIIVFINSYWAKSGIKTCTQVISLMHVFHNTQKHRVNFCYSTTRNNIHAVKSINYDLFYSDLYRAYYESKTPSEKSLQIRNWSFTKRTETKQKEKEWKWNRINTSLQEGNEQILTTSEIDCTHFSYASQLHTLQVAQGEPQTGDSTPGLSQTRTCHRTSPFNKAQHPTLCLLANVASEVDNDELATAHWWTPQLPPHFSDASHQAKTFIFLVATLLKVKRSKLPP